MWNWSGDDSRLTRDNDFDNRIAFQRFKGTSLRRSSLGNECSNYGASVYYCSLNV